MISKRSFTCILLLIYFANTGFSQRVNPSINYQKYIETYKEIAIKKMHEYRIPASITLAQGLLESSCGNSALALEANNHFGIKCHKEWTGMTYIMDDDEKGECFRKYSSPEESFNDHSLFLTSRPRYAGLFNLNIHDYKGWAYGLKSAGYATNPMYAEMLIKIIEENELNLYDSGARSESLPADKINHNKVNGLANKNHTASMKYDFEYVEVTNGNRSIYVNNGVRLVISRLGDTPESIADDVGVHTFQILKYNELGSKETISAGSIIYIEPKKKKASTEFHIMQEGEQMRDVAQLYAVKLKELYKKNELKDGHEPLPGTRVNLK